MEQVGARMKLDRPLRVCIMCELNELENAEHFACRCPHYAAERADCIQRIEKVIDGLSAPNLTAAMQSFDVALILGDGCLKELPKQKQRAVDAVICNFLKLAWRKRRKLWLHVCEAGDEWKLKQSLN